ncbi:hypothetical protein FHT85_002675 [Rhizobium sp. BK312]|nr:hypothetical protein [Rhizobium sp. BK312]
MAPFIYPIHLNEWEPFAVQRFSLDDFRNHVVVTCRAHPPTTTTKPELSSPLDF